jgi:hypothetical protein
MAKAPPRRLTGLRPRRAGWTRRAGFTVAVLLTMVGVAPVSIASGQVLGTVTAETPISAYRGWVVWSAPDSGRFRLVAWHAGATTVLPIGSRPQPFDVDLGTDARGRVVATFSRCPTFSADSGWRPPAARGEDCRLRVVDLATGSERGAGIAHPQGASDTTPSMWAGRIAFARRDPRHHKDVAQVLLWSPRTRTLATLRHGALPSHCPYRTGCRGLRVSGAVGGLDLGARLVSFLWAVQAPGVEGGVGFEVRADRLGDGRSVLVGSGHGGEACIGNPDSTAPSAPTSEGGRVWYGELSAACYSFTSQLKVYTTGPIAGRGGPLAGIVFQVAKDGPNIYGLVVPPRGPNGEPACTDPASPCTIQRLDPPALTSIPRPPASPFFF